MLKLLCFRKDTKGLLRKQNIRLSASLVISAHDEERILAQKIKNALELSYPEDLLEIAVISDGSTDGTNDIIRKI